MIKSMTGFGKADEICESREYQVEIKSVNHKYIDINIKLPKILSFLENAVKNVISQKAKRGKFDVFITYENNNSTADDIKINTELASMYIKCLRELAHKEGISSNIEVTEITKMPDVLKIETNLDENQIKQELNLVLEKALEQLNQMRETEGKKIAQDLKERINNIEANVVEISKLSTGLIEEYVVKLEARIKELLKTEELDKSRLMQEVVIYADKCSVEEEVTRLNSHISQFRNLLTSNEAVGKRLDFLVQEMNRETNTIGSKANNLDITNKVIDIKTELENIREQIQNIE